MCEEGQTIPADAQVICDYNCPEDFEKYKELKNKRDLSPDDEPMEKGDNEDEDDDDDDHHGYPILATDQSAITGESLAVDKYMCDTVYYTTGCKRGKVSRDIPERFLEQ